METKTGVMKNKAELPAFIEKFIRPTLESIPDNFQVCIASTAIVIVFMAILKFNPIPAYTIIAGIIAFNFGRYCRLMKEEGTPVFERGI